MFLYKKKGGRGGGGGEQKEAKKSENFSNIPFRLAPTSHQTPLSQCEIIQCACSSYKSKKKPNLKLPENLLPQEVFPCKRKRDKVCLSNKKQTKKKKTYINKFLPEFHPYTTYKTKKCEVRMQRKSTCNIRIIPVFRT